MDKESSRKRLAVGVGAALVVALIAGLVIWELNLSPQKLPEPPTPPVVASPVQVVGLSQAPADVQDAAAKLSTSRVGYAIYKPDRTYIILSTGSDALKVSYTEVAGQPDVKAPTFVDLFFNTDADGGRLLILTTPWGKGVEYQYDLDGQYGAIPGLVNAHNLPLVPLDETKGFAILQPVPDMLVQGDTLHVEGFARAFEAQFDVTIVSAKGRELGRTHVMAAAGMNNWGSFVADVPFDTTNLPATGLVIFEDQGGPLRFVVPIRFKPAELG